MSDIFRLCHWYIHVYTHIYTGVGTSPGVHFDQDAPNATSFPQIISTSHSFNTSLFHALGQAIATEARAFSNTGHAGTVLYPYMVYICR